MASYVTTIAKALQSTLSAIVDGRGHETGTFAPILETPTAGAINAQAGAHGGAAIEGVADGTPVAVSGTVTATVDTSALATQSTLAAVLAAFAALATSALQTTLNSLVTTPTIPTQITASDATDTSAITAKGLLVETAGDLAVRGTGAPSTTVTITVVAGQYVPIQCSRVMAASTATCVGLS